MKNSLAEMRPELVTEWSPRNLPIRPDEISYGSKKIYWWRGACGHEWEASAKARSQGEKCPLCAGKRIIPGVNDLASLMPELAAEWSKKNPIPATAVGVGSHNQAIWNGKCGHEWKAVIRSRAGGAGCPYCSHNLVLPGFNDLEFLFPEVAVEWSTANLPLLPSQVTAFSNKKISWICEKGHEWDALISTRSYGSKCPYCSGIKVLAGFNDLGTTHSQLIAEWSEKNASILPSEVNSKSTKNVWWNCKACGNEYMAIIKSRVQGLCCPVCERNAVLAGYNDLASTDPELMLEWDYNKNQDVSPERVTRESMRSVWWKGKCGHSWKAKVYSRVLENAECIYCKKEREKLRPQQLIREYANRMGVSVVFEDDSLIGIPIDAYFPDVKVAIVLAKKGTDKERRIITIQKYLCHAQGIECNIILVDQIEEIFNEKIIKVPKHPNEFLIDCTGLRLK